MEEFGTRPKKLVPSHGNMVVFVTREAKACGWDEKTILKVTVEKEGREKKIVIRKVGQL